MQISEKFGRKYSISFRKRGEVREVKEIGEKEETILKSPIENITAGKVIKQP